MVILIPHPLPALLLAQFFARSLTLVLRSLLLNRTETLATQAISKVDNVIQRINQCPVDNSIGFTNTYPEDSDLSFG